jgi:dipeptidase E
MTPRLLLLSNSTCCGQSYFEIWKATVARFLGNEVSTILFVPFAGVTITWSHYKEKLQKALPNYKILGLDEVPDKDKAFAVKKAEAIFIGGGNTFNLLYHLQKYDLLEVIKERVMNGAPYVGWSAGSNVATPDIGTTNDMPIVWPASDRAINLVPFNINPHFNEWKPPNYAGEGRRTRLDEAVAVKKRPIVAISEGTAILVEGEKYTILCPPENPGEPVVKVWHPSKVVDVPLSGVESPLNPYLM